MQSFIERIFTRTGRYPVQIRSDNAKEFLTSDLKAFFEEHGIEQQTSCVYTPQQNGVAERMNLTIGNSAKAKLDYAGFPSKFWDLAYKNAVYTHNLSPTASTPFSLTPFELWYEKAPDVSHLRIFGETGFLHVPNDLH